MTAAPARPNAASRSWDVLLPAIFLLVIARLWVMPIGTSFWVDEMGTVFVVQHGSDHPSLAVAPQVPQSLYYLLPRAADALFGVSEIAYRLPSLLAMVAALWVIARLAARLIHPEAAWFAVFACLSLRGFDYQAADARPYGLGTLAACACLWFLVRWLDSGSWRDARPFVAMGALLWRVQLIFWPFYLAVAIYTAVRLVRRDTPVPWKHAAVVFTVLGVSLIPVLPRAAALYRQAGVHVVVALPSVRDLVLSLKLGLVAACGAGGWLIMSKWGSRLIGQPVSDLPPVEGQREPLGKPTRHDTDVLLIACWWLSQPVCLFAFSWLTGNSVFVPRYLGLSLPGAALAATWAAGQFVSSRFRSPLTAGEFVSPAAPTPAAGEFVSSPPPTPAAREFVSSQRPKPPTGEFVSSRHWKPLAVALGAGVLLLNGQWSQPWPWHHNSDWRGAARKIREMRLPPDTPVICPSPFIEAKPPVWRPDYPLPGFLYAHLPVYPLPGKTWLFPFEDSPEAEAFARQLSAQTLSVSRQFVLYGGQGQVGFWREWLMARPELAGWSQQRFRQFGDVEVVVFRMGQVTSPPASDGR